MKHPNRNGKRAQRQQSASERQEAYSALTDDEKIARLRRSPGKAARQRKRMGL